MNVGSSSANCPWARRNESAASYPNSAASSLPCRPASSETVWASTESSVVPRSSLESTAYSTGSPVTVRRTDSVSWLNIANGGGALWEV
ncbi:hypothetical protein KM295_13380 [Natronomonas sp. F2-12]|uniref:Uncharacterized protein n=1 Tax=Natronomonas aquatica TaxID=2841590 RepID=A0A9R1D7T0_9EURY|nr:hypothetical protein [Natronomonas aquatica]MCQ4334450.1 hypothetical protein [Natronomonas aquatica]